jgi:hypothetical protein
MTTLDQRKTALLAMGCRIYTHAEAMESLPGCEMEEGEWIGTDDYALSLLQLERLDERGYKQLIREFQHEWK